MKAIRLIQPSRPLEMQEVPIPAVGPKLAPELFDLLHRAMDFLAALLGASGGNTATADNAAMVQLIPEWPMGCK